MPRRIVRAHHANGEALRRGISAIQAEIDVSPDFPVEVEAAAAHAAQNPKLPEVDRTDIPFVTIDPATSMDLDQALHIERSDDSPAGSGRPGGYVVHYAIADVAAFVEPGGAIDVEASKRGETLYGADSKIPLHPKVLSEDAASLLPGQVRPAMLWTLRLDGSGEGIAANVERALVRSRAKLDYESVQRAVDAGTADPMFTLLREVGELRLAREAARGGISLPLPEQQILIEGDIWSLGFRSMLPVEEWNAQISLLTGMAAASLMVYAGTGLLRTLPPPAARDIARLHRTAQALSIEWPAEQLYPDFIRSLDPTRPSHAAMVLSCTKLLRGAGYVGFHDAVPEQPLHSALASEYAHVTAPIRRLVDRYALEICVALCAETEVPSWVLERLPELPRTMQESGRKAAAYEGSLLALLEAAVLSPHTGKTFAGVVVALANEEETKGEVVIHEPAIETTVTATRKLRLGTDVTLRLAEADVASRRVRFELV